jgi:hypothetical protein
MGFSFEKSEADLALKILDFLVSLANMPLKFTFVNKCLIALFANYLGHENVLILVKTKN